MNYSTKPLRFFLLLRLRLMARMNASSSAFTAGLVYRHQMRYIPVSFPFPRSGWKAE